MPPSLLLPGSSLDRWRLPCVAGVIHSVVVPQGLRYSDAVKLLGGSSRLATIADDVLGGALSLATAGGSDLAVSLFDAKTEAIRIGHLVSGKIAEVVGGLGRYDRSQRLQAAHAVLVVAAFFEALDDCLSAAGMESPGFGRDDQVALATRRTVEGDWLGRLLAAEIPAPAAERTYNQLLDGLKDWFRGIAQKTADHLTGFAVWDQSNERTRHAVRDLLSTQLPSRAVERYEEAIRRLSEELPEVDIWLRQVESRAAARGLEGLEAALLRVTSSRDPGRQRAALTAAYRSELGRPMFSGDVGDVEMPTLGAAYVDPLFRVKPAGAGARPAEEEWWDTEPRRDLAGFLATYLTTPQAADAPMLLLGQPGAGKSSLTRVLAARLPAADFLVVRVALREVRAEAEIQDQVEQALRGAIGESVEWADLAHDADGAMPVILLDGFDELLQATGVHQSDYLQKVATFQQREAVLGRPVAVLVTSRVAVADRARLPAGALAVRLEPFDPPQIERWLETWNTTNAGRRPLSLDGLQRFHDLAVQPLLLLMLALYDAAGNPLSDVDENFDTGQLYERLLSEFADREVRRAHAGQPEPAMPGLVEAELLRLSVVAFAMFHRLRLWVTTEELDADLASLGLHPAQPSPAEGFRTPLTAGQEMVGRFFFIQRAQALQDDQPRQTYEFLHATFGEYLVARLVVQAVRDAAARAHARTLRLGPSDESDLLQSLLGFTPLTARTTVLPFATALIRRIASAEIRDWLVEQLRTAVTRPQYVPRPYQPVEKRVDHWMATYSFNLMLLTLACGGPLRASDLHQHASDPAGWLRNTALQWRAAVPGDMWLDALDPMTITRVWADDGRRDLILETSLGPPATSGDDSDQRDDVEDVDPFWSHGFGLDWDFRNAEPGGGFSNYFSMGPALKSMHLSNTLSEDALRHALEPLLDRMPNALVSFALQGPDDTESAAHSLVHLWLTSTLGRESGRLLLAYDRAVLAVVGGLWGGLSPDTHFSAFSAIRLFLRLLATDVNRLATADVVRLVRRVRASEWFDHSLHLLPAAECLLADTAPFADERDLLIDEMLFDLQTWIGGMSPEDCLRLLIALAGARSAAVTTTLAALEDRLATATVQERVRADPDFAARLYAARDRLSSDDEPPS